MSRIRVPSGERIGVVRPSPKKWMRGMKSR